MSSWKASEIPDLTGKVAIVTGGNAGIGLRIVTELAKHGATVYMASRSEEKCQTAIKEVEEKDAGSKGHIRFLKIDLMSMKACAAAADEFLDKEQSLHLLFNNAGIMAGPYFQTDDKLESQIATNHFGPFAFTQKLLPLMQKTAQSSTDFAPRIVNMSSIAHTYTTGVGLSFASRDDVNRSLGPSKLGAWRRYAVSKLCAILLSKELNARYPEIISVSAHPGIIKSNLWQNSILRYADFAFTSPEDGAVQPLYAAFGPADTVRGKYIVPTAKVGSPTSAAGDEKLAKQLWELSEKLVDEQQAS